MTTTTIQKWGNSYAVRLPKKAMQKLNLLAGHEVEIHEIDHNRALSVVPVREHSTSLTEMLSRITKKNQHGIVDWGSAMGREVW